MMRLGVITVSEREKNGEISTSARLRDVDSDMVKEMGEMRSLDREESNESLGLSSQHSTYYFGDDDITTAMLEFSTQTSGNSTAYGNPSLELVATQETNRSVEENPPASVTPSVISLGKRKAGDLSSSESISMQLFRPTKVAKTSIETNTKSMTSSTDSENVFLAYSPGPESPPPNPNEPIIHSPPIYIQRWIDKLPYGAQYEIARLVSIEKLNFKWEDVHMPDVERLAKLKTNAAAAPATMKTVVKDEELLKEINESDKGLWAASFAKENAARSPWEELDREEEALSKSSYGGLGFNEDGSPAEWYGGQVEFRATLKAECGPLKQVAYSLTLERPALGTSNQFARRFGSKSLIRIKLTKSVLNRNVDELMHYLRRPFVVCGGVFRAFFAKESNVFLIKTNEIFDGRTITEETLPGALSFLSFLEWHNSLALNNEQAIAKWASRFALGLSNSVPGLLLKKENLQFEGDIVHPETGSNMTDGAGSVNRCITRELRHRFSWEERPTAVQMRIFGSKGLLVDDKSDSSETPSAFLTPSQIKIQYSGVPPDPAHLIIDVLRSSHAKTPCRLSVETIINLAENGVPKHAFLELLKQSLKDLVEPLLVWDGSDAMRALWSNVRRLGGVMAARRAREEAGTARVKGHSERDMDEYELDDEDGFTQLDALEQGSSAWWNDEISGCPSSLEETIMCLLDSGFTPQTCPVLRDKLEKMIKTCVKNYIKTYRIDIPMSATAFIIPDKRGVLEEGEIFFKSSRRNLGMPDGTETDILLGGVLTTRHPCKLPTDIQKWKAVDRPQLHQLVDVIVFSTKGPRRAADWLSGGDYDGDKAIIIWQPILVNPFKNASPHYADPPANINSFFIKENESVPTFQARISPLPLDAQIREIQYYLLGAVRDTSVVGRYSNFHDNAIYISGYRHPDTIRLAYMFCMTLDGAKTGMTVLPDVLKNDHKKYQHRPPAWKETEDDRARYAQGGMNEPNLQRPPALGRFIMDDLHRQAEIEGSQWLKRIEDYFLDTVQLHYKLDEHLTAPYHEAVLLSERYLSEEKSSRRADDLQKIREHVQSIYMDHRQEMNVSPLKPKGSPRKDRAAFSNLPIEVRQNKIRALSQKFASGPPPRQILMLEKEIARIRASYAYLHDYEQKKSTRWTRFPWDVAMRELCSIKAEAIGRPKTVCGEFYDHFNVKHPKKHHI